MDRPSERVALPAGPGALPEWLLIQGLFQDESGAGWQSLSVIQPDYSCKTLESSWGNSLLRYVSQLGGKWANVSFKLSTATEALSLSLSDGTRKLQ